MLHLIFDTETTGLPKNWKAPLTDSDNWPRLVQLSWILTDGINKVEHDFIIKPNGFIIPEEVIKIHGITNERAHGEGFDLLFVMNIFDAYLKLADIVVTHNIDFDCAIVGAEYHRLLVMSEYHGLLVGNPFEQKMSEKKTYCTMKKAVETACIGGTHAGVLKFPKLKELYRQLFNEDFEGAHNSLMDVRATERCYFELIK